MAYASGSKITAVDVNAVKDKINTTAARYGIASLGAVGTVDNKVLGSDIQTLKDKLTTINANGYCAVKSDLSTITSYTTGYKILASILNTIEAKSTEIYNNYCTCQCNYCTCNCNYSCTCNCNYSCTCNCDNCPCQCNYCTCQCNYSCTCNCNYSCTCNCNNCLCNCDNCGCYCAWTGGGACQYGTCVLPDQLLYTSNGVKPAKDIETGDYILTHTGDYEEVYSKWEMANITEKIAVLKGKSYEMKVTFDHPLYVYSTDGKSLIKTSPEELVDRDLSSIKAIIPKLQKNTLNFDDNNQTFLYKLNVRIGKELTKLLPYMLLRGRFVNDNKEFEIDFAADEYDILKDCASYIENGLQTAFTDREGKIYIFTDEQNRIGSVPAREVIKSITEHGIPSWFTSYDDSLLKDFVDELGRINPDMIFDTKALAYQIRLVMADIGIEANIVSAGDKFAIETIGEMDLVDNYYLLDITSIETEEYPDSVYNFVLSDSHTYLADILLGDGFFCK